MNIFIMLIFLLFTVGEVFAGDIITGVVSRVVDGDTVHLLSDNVTYKIRLYGIDAPEIKQPYGKTARRKLQYYTDNKTITAHIITIDKYKRSVAILYDNYSDINYKMVISGFAWSYPKYCKIEICKSYETAQKEALKQRRGLWKPYPYSPEEWRRK